MLPSSTIILLSGGGNLGDLYPRHQELRERVLQYYTDNVVIQLPQSIFFINKGKKEKFRKICNKHKSFYMVVRDLASFDEAKQIHDGKNYLCPDMALCLGTLPRHKKPAYDIIGLLRSDKEKVVENISTVADFEIVKVFDWIKEKKTITMRMTTMVEKYQLFSDISYRFGVCIKQILYHELAKQRLRRGCKILSNGKVVITDRLHGHILCSLLEIPHVVLDNNYGKIKNFLKVWGTGGVSCRVADSLKDAIVEAKTLLVQCAETRPTHIVKR